MRSFDATLKPVISFGIPLATANPSGTLQTYLVAAIRPSGGGSGTVTSVNDVLPDVLGNVELTPGDIPVDNTAHYVIAGADLSASLDSVDAALLGARSTGARFGGALTSLGAGVVRLSAGAGEILDNSDPVTPQFVAVTWAQTDLDLSASEGLNYIYVNAAGTVTSTAVAPSHADYRTAIWLHRINIVGGVFSASTAIVMPLQQYGPGMWDIWRALGSIKRDLNLYADGANLSFNIGAGQAYQAGANFYTDPLSPHDVEFPAKTPAVFRLLTQTGTTTADTTFIDPLNYDVGGVVTPIPGATSRATILTVRMFLGGGGRVRIFYGQTWYSGVSAARAALNDGSYAPVFPASYAEALTLGWIIVSKGATALNDGIQEFVTANKFGGTGGAVSLTGSGALLAENNLSDLASVPDARTNLGLAALATQSTVAPSQITQAGATNGQAMVWNGSEWAPATVSAAPGGVTTQIQYNNAGAFAGVPGFTFSANAIAIASQAAGAIPFAIQAISGQTGNLTEWRDSVGAVQSRVRSDNDLETAAAIYFDDANGYIRRTAASNTMLFSPSGGSAAWSMTSSAFEFQSAGSGFFYTAPAATSGAQVTFNIQPRDRGGNSGVGNIVNVRGGKGSTAATGSAGGAAGLYGGDAAGSGNNNGGAVTIQGGAPTGSGTRGAVQMATLPTSPPAGYAAGDLWSQYGVLRNNNTSAAQATTATAVSSAAGVLTIDLSLGALFSCLLTENITSIVYTNAPAAGSGNAFSIEFTQAAGASYTVTGWPANTTWPNATPWAMTATNNAIDEVGVTYYSSTKIRNKALQAYG